MGGGQGAAARIDEDIVAGRTLAALVGIRAESTCGIPVAMVAFANGADPGIRATIRSDHATHDMANTGYRCGVFSLSRPVAPRPGRMLLTKLASDDQERFVVVETAVETRQPFRSSPESRSGCNMQVRTCARNGGRTRTTSRSGRFNAS